MNFSNIYKYYDLRYDFYKNYISPVEFKKEILEKGDKEISTKYSDPFFNIYVIDVIELIRD